MLFHLWLKASVRNAEIILKGFYASAGDSCGLVELYVCEF